MLYLCAPGTPGIPVFRKDFSLTPLTVHFIPQLLQCVPTNTNAKPHTHTKTSLVTNCILQKHPCCPSHPRFKMHITKVRSQRSELMATSPPNVMTFATHGTANWTHHMTGTKYSLTVIQPHHWETGCLFNSWSLFLRSFHWSLQRQHWAWFYPASPIWTQLRSVSLRHINGFCVSWQPVKVLWHTGN